MSFRDLGDLLAEQPVVLPIRGRAFTFPGSVSARQGLTLQRIQSIAIKAAKGELPEDEPRFTDEEQEAILDALLGDQKEDLLDYATSTEYALVCRTLYNHHLFGRAVAEKVWNAQGEAEAPAPAKTEAGDSPAGSSAKPSRKARPGPKSSTAGT